VNPGVEAKGVSRGFAQVQAGLLVEFQP